MAGTLSNPRNRLAARFSRAEIRHMNKLLQHGKEELLDPVFHQKLADEFNLVPGRRNRAIQVQQVQRWFVSRIKNQKTVDVIVLEKEMSPAQDSDLPNNLAESFSDLPDDGKKVCEEMEMDFEAKSYRDQAWYDVSTFLAHRVLSSGEVEVRVRFHGFGPEEDEWVNVRKAVRERSIPVESSECWKIKEGDSLICFREKDEAALYFDARVLEVERKMHDIRGCRCIFFIQYDHDQAEERVQLNRLCRRP
ncbi:hypothetical protein HPP92_009638 [Vanilla planifolia]|uniref:SAWADEE domain-containing protein n=1 Tax=Vanilla planifolia TaxID=51239 RepID=A0A835RBW8_VANPL|nr:hypothetical protein HPP92_009638 [Vanilla planifolia]